MILFALFLGYIGVHDFVLGRKAQGIIKIVLTVLGIPTFGVTLIAVSVWCIIDAVQIAQDRTEGAWK